MKRISLVFISLLAFASGGTQALERLRLATTTSTDNSGLLAKLHPLFEEQAGVKIDVIAVGTGKALKLGENGDVDVVMVHAPAAELNFVNSGFGIERRPVMHNDFVIIGPAFDPVGIKASKSAVGTFRELSKGKGAFISRGDDSGTHKKEKILWQLAGIKPAGSWYIESGQGMGTILTIANEKQAYTLSDRGTYIAYQDKLNLAITYSGGTALSNPYHIMAVNPDRYKNTNYDLAKKYINFVTSPKGQQIIGDFKKKGQQLFYPNALGQ